ncbi:phytoene desaturase family protein [Marinicrinis sediminis]|uniref:Phytoene desaturase family protein n=1 Tax=Marinicrinis sediminis TaxID=1652465 RepID=A0ABW5R6J6_9BACL
MSAAKSKQATKSTKSTPKKAVIIGAGPGGLAAGMLLSAQQYEVHVYEKQPFLGGRTSRMELGEYAFDLGPTFLMMPHLLEELFTLAGRQLEDYVKWLPLDPLYTLKFGEMSFSPTLDREEMVDLIEDLFPGNGKGYLSFMKNEGKKYDRVEKLLQQPFTSITDYVNLNVFKALPRLHAWDTVYQRLSSYFSDERLIHAFTFQAKYLGMSPWECPGTFTILSYLEHRYGLMHPIGGVNQICKAMASVIEENGGTVHLAEGVKQVKVTNGKATGLILESGEETEADHVVINADFGTAMTQLFAPGVIRKYTPEKLEQKKWSCSTFMLYLGVNREIEMNHHTILFSSDYKKNVDEIVRTQTLSDDPSIYVHNPSRLDPTLAPKGKSSLYVLMPCPNLDGNIDWEQQKEAVREQVLNRLEQEPELRNLRQDIEVEKMLTPLDWQQDIFVYKGATFNMAHTLDQMMYLRPRNQFEEVENCWLVGGGTHPGSGLPTIMESAKISTDLIQKQDQRKSRFLGVSG